MVFREMSSSMTVSPSAATQSHSTPNPGSSLEASLEHMTFASGYLSRKMRMPPYSSDSIWETKM